jgi:haloacetate dehalogenase
MMFPGFQQFDIDCNGINIHGVKGGSGPPLLLLHGYPQTHVMWHKIAPPLAERFTIIAADLRGYGRSDKPPSETDHASYSKRAMAADMVRLMAHFGFLSFRVCGHDRGARVAHRMALDAPDAVIKMVLLDIAPTREMYANTNDAFARAYWHWFYLILPAPLPERMIGADPVAFWTSKCTIGTTGLALFDQGALDNYLECFSDPAVIHGSCEDYRAAASIDIEHDNADDGRKVECPLLVIWGEDGVIERCFDALGLWRLRASDVTGFAMPGGHYLAEEHPQQLFDYLMDFY